MTETVSKPIEVTQRILKDGAKYSADGKVLFEVKPAPEEGRWLVVDHVAGVTHTSKGDLGLTLEHWLRVVRVHIRQEHHYTVKGIEN